MNKDTICYYQGTPYSEGSEVCMEGFIKVCRNGEWNSTGTPCGIEQVSGATVEIKGSLIFAPKAAKGTSIARAGIDNCREYSEGSKFETTTGRIKVSTSDMPPEATLRSTVLRSDDGLASYMFAPGYANPKTIKPGRSQ